MSQAIKLVYIIHIQKKKASFFLGTFCKYVFMKYFGMLSIHSIFFHQVEQTDVVPNSFTIYGGNKCLPLAAR